MTYGSRALVLALVATGALVAGCGSDGGGPAVDFDYPATAQAPDPSDYPDGSETDPGPDDGVVTLEMDGGATVAIWIDPDDITKVYQQHSDPDDDAAWTEPELLYTAGDGCLSVYADTDGETLAATLGCYADDAWIQQAPEHGQAVVTTDLAEWTVKDMGEFYYVPSVDDGKVTWVDDFDGTPEITWTYDDGFVVDHKN